VSLQYSRLLTPLNAFSVSLVLLLANVVCHVLFGVFRFRFEWFAFLSIFLLLFCLVCLRFDFFLSFRFICFPSDSSAFGFIDSGDAFLRGPAPGGRVNQRPLTIELI
jgi:hypothetical protein